jgi:hypothetical protein
VEDQLLGYVMMYLISRVCNTSNSYVVYIAVCSNGSNKSCQGGERFCVHCSGRGVKEYPFPGSEMWLKDEHI